MPRRLPWLENTAVEGKKKKSVSAPAPRRKPGRRSSQESLVDQDLNPLDPESPAKPETKSRPDRTPSTSPPPAPPDVEYMQEGYKGDDVYMMVEDEFLSTAKTFTEHLHHAEYVRSKKLARSRGAEVLEAIQRPVDGRTKQSTALEMEIEAKERAKSIKTAMKGDRIGSCEDEDELIQDPQLAGLMAGVSRTSKDLSSIAKPKANTRAAAGYDQSPRNRERTKNVFSRKDAANAVSTTTGPSRSLKRESFTDNEDDLDIAPTKSIMRSPIETGNSRSIFSEFTGDRKKDAHAANMASSDKVRREEPNPKDASGARPNGRLGPLRVKVEVDTVSPKIKVESTNHTDYFAKRRADRERREREEKRKAKAASVEVPTFAV